MMIRIGNQRVEKSKKKIRAKWEKGDGYELDEDSEKR